MKIIHRIFFILLIGITTLSAQEVLLSSTEQYYDFLSLDGFTDRPYLNYRTLSDSKWDITDENGNIWKENNLGSTRALTEKSVYRIYGPELFSSFNTATSYGQNDGALWQGKGLNSSLSGGIRFEGYGLELTLKPQVVFSQNLAFDLIPSAYNGDQYLGKADTYGYYGVSSIDAPQRFGDSSFFDFSWGDTEIRYSWKKLTAGFGTQSIWLGPAKINPILHSNNAAPYPKIDFGLRRTKASVLGWYVGDIEARAWWGYSSESEYFDTDSSNDHNLITGLTVSFAPSFLDGFTVGVHRMMLSKWNERDMGTLLTLLWPFMELSAGKDTRDQRASLTLNYLLPDSGMELYLEWARNDYSPSLDYIIRYPFHTQGYTLGGQKNFSVFHHKNIRGNISVEFTNLESSRDYESIGATTFYAHHIITQGHTNEGQWLGAGMGTGGNSQFVGLELFYSKGNTMLYFQRTNPDNDYIWYSDDDSETRIRADLTVGLSGNYFINSRLKIPYGLSLTDSHNYDYQPNSSSKHRYNININTGLNLQL